MSKNKQIDPKLGAVGGQAVMEGVMMRSKKKTAIAVRQLDGKIVTERKDTKSLKDKSKFFRIPIIRGVVNFIDSLVMSFSTLTRSTEMLGFEEEEPTKFEKWLEKKFGASLVNFVSAIGVVLGVVLALVLFIWLPTFIAKISNDSFLHIGDGKSQDIYMSLIEGVLKILIFLAYISLTALIPDIKRVYQYHGAEHKSIFCYEAGLELNVENVKKQIRFHPRCGTSFMFIIMFISIAVSACVPWNTIYDAMPSFMGDSIVKAIGKLLLLPIVVGIGYEYIMYAGKHCNLFTSIFSAPGLWIQRITTKEPDDSQMEVAITSLKFALPDDFPDFTPEPFVPEPKAESNKNDVAASSGDSDAADKTTKDNNAKE